MVRFLAIILFLLWPWAAFATVTVQITVPTSAATYTTTGSTIVLQGTVSTTSGTIERLVWDNIDTDNAGITLEVSQPSGYPFTTAAIALKQGANEILLTGTASDGLVGTDTITITRTASGPTFSNVTANSTTVTVYEKYEVSFSLDTSAKHPMFEYSLTAPAPGQTAATGVTVTATFTSPSSVQYTQPAFYYTDVVDDSGSPAVWNTGHWNEGTNSGWKVRFSPKEIGTWNVSLSATDSQGFSNYSVGSFTALAPVKKGFIQVSATDTRYFEYSNRDLFWPGGPADSAVADYSDYKDTGMNLERPWMAGKHAYSSQWFSLIRDDLGPDKGFSSPSWWDTGYIYPGHELAYKVEVGANSCAIWTGSWSESDPLGYPHLVNGTTYLVKVRLKTNGITGNGLYIKTHAWPETPRCGSGNYFASLTSSNLLGSPISGTKDWHTIVTMYTANSTDSGNTYLAIFLDATAGSAYIDQISIREIISPGVYGGELYRHSKADIHTYVDQKGAYYFDKQVEQGESNGVTFSYVVQEWSDVLLNSLNTSGVFVDGGDGVLGFFQGSGTRVEWLQKQWWRHLIARLGYSTAIHSWEVCNEAASGNSYAWAKGQAFANYMKANDYHKHPASISFSCCSNSGLWTNKTSYPDMGFSTIHVYGETDDGSPSCLGYLNSGADWVKCIADKQYAALSGANIPQMLGETGFGQTGLAYDAYYDALLIANPGIWFHNSLWVDIGPHPIYPFNWWYAEWRRWTGGTPEGPLATPIYDIAAPFYKFMQGIKVNKGGYVDSAATCDDSDIRVIGQKNTTEGKAHLWVQNKLHDWCNDMGSGCPASYQTITSQSGTITLRMTANKVYKVERWNTWTGAITSTALYTADANGDISIATGTFHDDFALKVELPEWSTRGVTNDRVYSVPYDLPLDGNDQLNLRWKRFFGERVEVEVEPVVVGDYVYVAVENGKLYSLYRSNGNINWAYQAGGPLTDTPTAFYDKDNNLRIVFGCADGYVYCLNTSGVLVWRYDTGSPLRSTPAVHSNAVLIGNVAGNFYSIDATAGTLNWSYACDSAVGSTPAVGDIGSTEVDGYAIYFSTLANTAYALKMNGTLLWSNSMWGVPTRWKTATFAKGSGGKRVVMFTTKKNGSAYRSLSEAGDEGDPTVDTVAEWATWFTANPRRRVMYIYNAVTGADLWPGGSSTTYAPLMVNYWNHHPVVDVGNGYLYIVVNNPCCTQNDSLMRLDLETGTWVLESYESFRRRDDEIDTYSLINQRYFGAISEDTGYYDITTNITSGREPGLTPDILYGNGYSNHRYPLEVDQYCPGGADSSCTPTSTIFGGMHKQFTKFAGSSPSGFAGGVDAVSPIVVAGNEAYVMIWGHLHALGATGTSSGYTCSGNCYGESSLDLLTSAPTVSLTRAQVITELNAKIQAIYTADPTASTRISPFWRKWNFFSNDYPAFWFDGETVKTLARAVPFLNEPLKTTFSAWLKTYIGNFILNATWYSGTGCLNYLTTPNLQTSCTAGTFRTTFAWDNANHAMDRLYALYQYALVTGDWAYLTSNWSFINGTIYAVFTDRWNGTWFSFPSDTSWGGRANGYMKTESSQGFGSSTPFFADLQIASMYALYQIATHAGQTSVANEANSRYTTMLANRVSIGSYVRGLGLSRTYTTPNSWGYDTPGGAIPPEGSISSTNDIRQVFDITNYAYEWSVPYVYDAYPWYPNGFYPVFPEVASTISGNATLSDIVSDMISYVSTYAPAWYMGSYAHASLHRLMEEDSFTDVGAAGLFQMMAKYQGKTFTQLKGYLPWPTDDYSNKDIFRLQNLVTLLEAQDDETVTPTIHNPRLNLILGIFGD